MKDDEKTYIQYQAFSFISFAAFFHKAPLCFFPFWISWSCSFLMIFKHLNLQLLLQFNSDYVAHLSRSPGYWCSATFVYPGIQVQSGISNTTGGNLNQRTFHHVSPLKMHSHQSIGASRNDACLFLLHSGPTKSSLFRCGTLGFLAQHASVLRPCCYGPLKLQDSIRFPSNGIFLDHLGPPWSCYILLILLQGTWSWSQPCQWFRPWP